MHGPPEDGSETISHTPHFHNSGKPHHLHAPEHVSGWMPDEIISTQTHPHAMPHNLSRAHSHPNPMRHGTQVQKTRGSICWWVLPGLAGLALCGYGAYRLAVLHDELYSYICMICGFLLFAFTMFDLESKTVSNHEHGHAPKHRLVEVRTP